MLRNKENEKQYVQMEEELGWNSLSGNNPTFCDLEFGSVV